MKLKRNQRNRKSYYTQGNKDRDDNIKIRNLLSLKIIVMQKKPDIKDYMVPFT